MADTLDLTTWTDSRSWVANGARLQQQTETVDLQFKYGSGTYKSAVRFLANGDLRLFGELITETGALLSYATLAFTSLDASQDVASFRSGPAAGTEVLRVASTGRIRAASGSNLELEGKELVTYATDGSTTTEWGRLNFVSGTRTLNVGVGSTVEGLGVTAEDLQVRLWRPGTSAVTTWGVLSFDTASNERLVDCTSSNDGIRLKGKELVLQLYNGSTHVDWGRFGIDPTSPNARHIQVSDGSGVRQDLEVRVRALVLKADYGGTLYEWGSFYRTAGGENQLNSQSNLHLSAAASGGTWKDIELKVNDLIVSTAYSGTLYKWGTFSRESQTNVLESPDHLYIRALAGSTFKNITIHGEKVDIVCNNDDCVRFKDSSETIRYKFTMGGQAFVTAKANQHAELSLDATATSGAKKWALRSAKDGTPTGSLKFVNLTDNGTPTVEFEPAGHIYTPGYIGGKTTTAAPSDTDGRIGAWAIDTTNKRIWVKVADSGSNRWWYTSLVSP
jgi:hypothetical protein